MLRLLECSLFVAAFLFLAVSGFFIFQQSQDRGLPMFSFGLPIGGGGSTLSASGFAHQNGPCSSCHKSIAQQARIYLAINGKDVSESPSVSLRAGEAFDLAYHFEGMSGSKHGSTGIELTLPQGQGWSVGQGSGKPVEGWSERGSGGKFWSPAWSKGDSGAGKRGGRWNPISGQAGLFYMEFSSSDWSVPGISAAAADDGGAVDLDGRSNSMGGDAVISVPFKAKPGRYEIVLGAMSVDPGGNPSLATKRIVVQVDPAPALSGKPGRGPVFKPDHGKDFPCGTCHEVGTAVDTSHRGRGNDTCTQCHTTTISGPPPPGAPRIPHAVDGRADCISCHGQGQLRPEPADHGGRQNYTCVGCHQAPDKTTSGAPLIPHSLEGRSNCASCHGSGAVPAVPADHANRPNEMCTLCHPKSYDNMVAGAPDIPHTSQDRSQCLTCHGKGFLGPVIVSHAGMAGDNTSCQNCHKALPQVNVPGRAPNTPHTLAGRSDCLACHGPNGMRPEPSDHVGRPSAACAGCHQSDVDAPGRSAMIPHVIAGREDCLTCHGDYLIRPVPGDHNGRTNDTCGTCHRKSDA